MRKIIFVLCGGILLALAGNAACAPQNASSPAIHQPPQMRPRFAREEITIRTKNNGQRRLQVEVARTMDELAYGLMRITALPKTQGMLFIAPTLSQQTFWMKETLLPLDILFLDAAGRIIGIHPNAQPHSLHYIRSHQPAKAVLEIMGGMAKQWRLSVGDRIISRDFKP